MATTYPRVVIRKVDHLDGPGYLVRCYRRPGEGHYAPGVWVKTYRSAIRCKVRFKLGEEITLEDMTLPDLRVVR